MKILIIQFSGIGGIQLYTSQLANALAKRHEVHVLIGDYLYNDNYYDQNVRVTTVKASSSYGAMLLSTLNPLTYYKISRIIDDIRPDVIHVTYEFPWDALVMLLKRKYPLVYTLHDPAFHNEGFNVRAVLAKAYLGFSKYIETRRADAVIVHGKSLKKFLLDRGVPDNKVRVMRHGEYSLYRKWEKDNVKEVPGMVLFFGRVMNYKGLEYLIAAQPEVSLSINNLKIIIAGAGDFTPYDKLIKNRSAFEIINRYIPDEEVAPLFQSASIVVLPYIGGSQTGVVPIAYSFKKPVIVTDVGSLGEAVEEGVTGLIVPARDPKALAAAILRLLKDEPLRREMGENGYHKVTGELSWDVIAEQTVDIYRSISSLSK